MGIMTERAQTRGVRDPGTATDGGDARQAMDRLFGLYLLAAGVSWALSGDFGARNVFERQAGLADGGYTDKPLRWVRPVVDRPVAHHVVSG